MAPMVHGQARGTEQKALRKPHHPPKSVTQTAPPSKHLGFGPKLLIRKQLQSGSIRNRVVRRRNVFPTLYRRYLEKTLKGEKTLRKPHHPLIPQFPAHPELPAHQRSPCEKSTPRVFPPRVIGRPFPMPRTPRNQTEPPSHALKLSAGCETAQNLKRLSAATLLNRF